LAFFFAADFFAGLRFFAVFEAAVRPLPAAFFLVAVLRLAALDLTFLAITERSFRLEGFPNRSGNNAWLLGPDTQQ
jgi:hypothetical protein